MATLDAAARRNARSAVVEPAPNGVRGPAARWVAPASVGLLLAVLVVLWFRARPFDTRVVNLPAAFGAASGLTALAGTVLLSVTIVLSARVRFLEGAVGGLDRVYRLHHWLGGIAFALVGLHPSLLAWRYAQVSWQRAAHLWLPSTSNWALTAGQVALWGMAAALSVTVFAKVRHQVLLWLQRFLGVLMLPAAVHVFRVGGDVANYAPLRIYLGVVVGAGIVALGYHTVLGRVLVRGYRYQLVSVRQLVGGVTDLRLAPLGRPIAFVPGQFGFLRFRHDPIGGEAHPFSFASSPDVDELRFVVKDLGDYTGGLAEVEPGTEAVVEGPYGRFSHRFVAGRDQVWVGGGIGIAPFLAMAASLPPSGFRVDLYYAVVDAAEAPFLAELTAAAMENPALNVRLVEERTDGFVTADLLVGEGGPHADREFLLCGPPAMMHALRDGLLAAGVPATRVHFEEFGF